MIVTSLTLLQDPFDILQAVGCVPAGDPACVFAPPLERFVVASRDSIASVAEMAGDDRIECRLADDAERLKRVAETTGVSLCELC